MAGLMSMLCKIRRSSRALGPFLLIAASPIHCGLADGRLIVGYETTAQQSINISRAVARHALVTAPASYYEIPTRMEAAVKTQKQVANCGEALKDFIREFHVTAPKNRNIWCQLKDKKPAPQLTYTERKGLDVQNNRIDQLINTFGFVCEKRALYPKRCRIETELISYLKTLPSSLIVLVQKLTSLGAVCKKAGETIDCVYKRHVEQTVWSTGEFEPIAIIDEFFEIGFAIQNNDGSLRYEVNFDRVTKVKMRRGDPKRT